MEAEKERTERNRQTERQIHIYESSEKYMYLWPKQDAEVEERETKEIEREWTSYGIAISSDSDRSSAEIIKTH